MNSIRFSQSPVLSNHFVINVSVFRIFVCFFGSLLIFQCLLSFFATNLVELSDILDGSDGDDDGNEVTARAMAMATATATAAAATIVTATVTLMILNRDS